MKQVKLTLVGIIALVIGVLTISFKSIQSAVNQQDEYVWYIKDMNGNWSQSPQSGPPTEEPPTAANCDSGPVKCAIGFLPESSAPPLPITDETESDTDRHRLE